MGIPFNRIGDKTPGAKEKDQALRKGGFVVMPPVHVAPTFYARVVNYHTDSDSYDVMSLGLGGLIAAGARFDEIPRRIEDPSVAAPLSNGTIVQVDRSGGLPIITGVVPLDSNPVAANEAENVPDFGESTTTTEYASTSFFGRAIAKGLIPGDWVRKTQDGNYFALLRKGINWLYANKRTQFILSRVGDFAGLYTQNFIFRSAIGDLQIGQQESGEGFLTFDAGFDLLNDVAYKATKYTLGIALGHAAKQVGGQDCLASLVIKDPDSKAPVSGVYFTNKGRIKFMAHSGFDFVAANKGDYTEEFGANRTTRILGNRNVGVSKSRFQTVEQQDELVVGANRKTTVGNDQYGQVNRNRYDTVQGNYILTVRGGDVVPELPTVNGYEIQCVNNSYVVEVGNKSLQTIPLTLGLYMHNGEVVIGENPLSTPATLCQVSINTLKPGMIMLGGNTLSPPTNAPVLHNEMAEWLATMLGIFDGHTHPTAWGPSGTPISLMSPSLSSKVAKLRSTYVLLKA